jgi:hypothetical protein
MRNFEKGTARSKLSEGLDCAISDQMIFLKQMTAAITGNPNTNDVSSAVLLYDEAEPTAASKSGAPRRSSGSIRTARWRDRRQRGFKVFRVEVCADDIRGLVARGLLDRLRRDDDGAVQQALSAWLDQLAI